MGLGWSTTVDLLDAERVVVKVVECGAHPWLPELAVPKVHLHEAPVVTLLDRRDGLHHARAGDLSHNRRGLVGPAAVLVLVLVLVLRQRHTERELTK